MTKQSKGFSAVAGVIIVLILGIGVAVGYYLYDQNQTNTNTTTNANINTVVNTNTNTNSTVGAQVDDSQATPAMVEEVVEGINDFTFDLYANLKTEEGNLFFSPYSISTALAMTYEGAKGQTAEEMQQVFNWPTDDLARRAGYASIYNEINKGDKEYTLNTANALWAELDFTFLDSYFDLVGQYYGGKVTNLDFKTDSENSRLTINNWVEEKTEEKIIDLIPQGEIDALTRLVLTNAIYFKGTWVKQFDPDKTTDSDFRLSSETTVQVPTMQRTDKEAEFSYMENDQLQILQLPYEGKDLSMLVLLPKDDDLDDLENLINSQQLTNWKSELNEQRVFVYLPSFKFETKSFLADLLKEMGMPTAFSGGADFSGMTGKQDLAISQVIHQAFVEVNEEGTEAAAATAVIMKETSVSVPEEIPIFRADHPFLFLIQQTDTGNILFMGRVSDPR